MAKRFVSSSAHLEERVALVATPQLAPLDEPNVRALASSIQIQVEHPFANNSPL